MVTWALFFACGSFIVGLLRLFLAVLEFVMKLQKGSNRSGQGYRLLLVTLIPGQPSPVGAVLCLYYTQIIENVQVETE